jgi:hypothetical protein
MTIKTSLYKAKLEKIINYYVVSFEVLDIVPDIMKWSEEHRIEEDNPWRAGKCVRNLETGKYRILLAEEISYEMRRSIIGAMEIRGFSDSADVLNDEEKFLVHLLLHEIAHALHNDWTEDDCDKWAFTELERHTRLNSNET